MAKTSFKKKKLSEKILKKTGKVKNCNPFEIRVNKQKFDVLGRKSKNDRGLPGIARAKSIKKRKETLLQEYKVKDKANKFVDRRIGENNAAMTQEDRIMARYTAERIKAHNKKTMFNLADEEVLTHKGKTLSEIEKYDDPGSDDEEEFNGKGGGLEADIVEAHFGGGIFHEKGDGAKTHASLIDELIAESKKRKAERQRAKEQTLELTDKLDADWRELLPLVGAGKASDDTELKPKKGSYDQLMKELKFESRGVPSDKLKSEDELAKEEKEKLEKLEEERLQRMRGLEAVKVSVPKHRSADDLDDGFEIESDLEDTSNAVNESQDDCGDGNSSVGESDESEDDDSDDANFNNENDGDNENNVEQNEDEHVKSEVCGSIEGETGTQNINEEKNCEEGSDNDGSESDDDLSDLKDHSDDDDQDVSDTSKSLILRENSQMVVNEGKENLLDNKNDKPYTEEFIESLKLKKEQMEKARKELPYTFKLPESYEELESMMENYNVEHQGIILERMIKCHHPSLGDNNRQKLQGLFAFLLQYLNDADDEIVWKLLDQMAPHLFDLSQFSPENSAHSLLEVITEKHEDFRKQPHKFPKADTLVFLKLIPLLFPTSDIRHQVTTPAFVFLIQILNQCRITGRRAISTGLFVVTMLLEYTALSKRFSPDAVNFLQGVLEMAVPDINISLPYCKTTFHPLVLKSSLENQNEADLRLACTETASADLPIDDNFRIRALYTAIRLLNILCSQLEGLPSFKLIFSPIENILNSVKISNYPASLKSQINSLKTIIKRLCDRKLQYVVLERKKPKALRLYEPLIEKVIDGKKRRNLSQEKEEQQKLVAKYKQEMKGALREIRRDAAFLNKVKLHEKTKSDEERKRKVKQIYSWGAAQEGEFNKLKRKKKN